MDHNRYVEDKLIAQIHLEEIAFSIIAAADDGRAKVTEALKAASDRRAAPSRMRMHCSSRRISCRLPNSSRRRGAGERKDPFNVLVAHAPDYVMTGMVMKEMAEEIVNLYEKVAAK